MANLNLEMSRSRTTSSEFRSLSPLDKAAVLVGEGKSFRDASKLTNIPKSTISDYVKCRRDGKEMASAGRPKCLTSAEESQLMEAIDEKTALGGDLTLSNIADMVK